LATRSDARPLCPSAPPAGGSAVFGVVVGTVEAPRVAYLPARLLFEAPAESADPAFEPGEVFRFAAPCAGRGCAHFDGADCRLASRLVERLPPVVDILPHCALRPDCRWWRQEGAAACVRCPQVVTETWHPSDELSEIAAPAPQ